MPRQDLTEEEFNATSTAPTPSPPTAFPASPPASPASMSSPTPTAMPCDLTFVQFEQAAKHHGLEVCDLGLKFAGITYAFLVERLPLGEMRVNYWLTLQFALANTARKKACLPMRPNGR